MREGTHLPVVADVDIVGVGRTKLGLILLWVIKLLHPVVAFVATIAIGAHCLRQDGVAQLADVAIGRTALVFGFGLVVVETFLGVVGALILARNSFEQHQVEYF